MFRSSMKGVFRSHIESILKAMSKEVSVSLINGVPIVARRKSTGVLLKERMMVC